MSVVNGRCSVTMSLAAWGHGGQLRQRPQDGPPVVAGAGVQDRGARPQLGRGRKRSQHMPNHLCLDAIPAEAGLRFGRVVIGVPSDVKPI